MSTTTQQPVKRTPYMQKLMTATYHNVAVEAVMNGFNGSWERLIARRLEEEVRSKVSEAEVLLEAAGGDPLKAAYIVTGSKGEGE